MVVDKDITFYEKMRIICTSIPYGNVATYGQIAMLCGKPKNSRQVGYGLKYNLAGEEIPAHRIVNGKGELSGAKHFQIPGTQRDLLEGEGIEVFADGNSGYVDLRKYSWRTTLEDAEKFKTLFQKELYDS